MTTPCPTGVSCFPCFDEPIENISSEETDSPSFLGVSRVRNDPRLGSDWSKSGCLSWCYSNVSQAEADLCALQQAQLCVNPTGNFFSAQQTCVNTCPGGGTVTEIIPAGTVISSISQADADARAYALACKQSKLTACSSVVIPGTIPNQAQGVSCIDGGDLVSYVTLPTNLSITGPTLTVAAGSFFSSTQSAANAIAAAYVDAYMQTGLTSGDLECIDPWVFVLSACGSDAGPVSIPGVSLVGFTADSQPVACLQGTFCDEGITPDTSYDFSYHATLTIGPYGEDKEITLDGSYNLQRFPSVSPCGTTTQGNSNATLKLFGVGSYSGDMVKFVNFSTGNTDSGLVLVTGILASGNTAVVDVTCIAHSRAQPPVCNCIFDITVEDSP